MLIIYAPIGLITPSLYQDFDSHLTLSPFRLNDLAVGFNIKEMIITC